MTAFRDQLGGPFDFWALAPHLVTECSSCVPLHVFTTRYFPSCIRKRAYFAVAALKTAARELRAPTVGSGPGPSPAPKSFAGNVAPYQQAASNPKSVIKSVAAVAITMLLLSLARVEPT